MFRRRANSNTAVVLDLWGHQWARLEVAGVQHRKNDVLKLVRATTQGQSYKVTAQLVPEPSNRHDRNAVQVVVDGTLVGYLPAVEAKRYQPLLNRLVADGYAPQCGAEIYASRGSDGGGWADVRLALDQPHLILPLNSAPRSAHVVLPFGPSVQVGGEEQHMDVLRPWTRPEGEGWLYVTLHRITEQLARSTREVVEVRVDGARVGQLTPKMSGEFAPIIDVLEPAGVVVSARGLLKGNSLKADISIHAERAGGLDETWIAQALAKGTMAAPAAALQTLTTGVAEASSRPAEVVVSEAGPPTGGWPPPTPPAGWFPNPDGKADLRWWDGRAWTEHTHPRPSQ